MPRMVGLAFFALLLFHAEAFAAGADSRLTRQLDEAVNSEVAKGFSGAVLVARGSTILLDVLPGGNGGGGF